MDLTKVTPIYLHEYTFIPWNKEKMGLQSIVVTVVTESKERDSFIAERMISAVDLNHNVSHKILLEGYRND